jgi:glycolate oxidase
VPRTRLPATLARVEEVSREYDLRIANVFHAGDGNLHPLILFDGRVAGAHDRAEACAAEILRLCIALGGSITGEHGVGLEKRDFLAEQYGEVDIACMKELQRTMDPRDIANPGKVFAPATPADAARHFAATAAAASAATAAASERVPS